MEKIQSNYSDRKYIQVCQETQIVDSMKDGESGWLSATWTNY